MSVDKQRLVYVVTDYICTIVAILMFSYVRYMIDDRICDDYSSFAYFIRSEGFVVTLTVFPFMMLLVYYLTGYYTNVVNKSRVKEMLSTLLSALCGVVIFYMGVLINDMHPGRALNYEMLLSLFICLFLPVYIGRVVITTMSILKRSGSNLRRMVLVGSNVSADDYIRKNGKFLDAEGMVVVYVAKPTCAADIMGIDGYLLNIDSDDRNLWLNALNVLIPLDKPIYISPSNYELVMLKVRYDNVMSEPMVDVSKLDIPDYVAPVKRFSDVMIAILGLIITAPIVLVLGIIVKIQSPGPILYKQWRVGYHRRRFQIYKLRSMVVDAESDEPRLSSSADTRVTPIGKFMRKYHLDELPNLWNVVIGDMSIVGPRPEREYFIGKIMESAPYYALVQKVRPGLTSLGMVKYGYASSVDEMVERLKYDILYIQNLSPSLDMKIMFHTIRTLIKGEGI